MFNTTRVPVKVYRWDDPEAPAVKAKKGAIKTILKACLSTGYGGGENRKEPLGWDILFEEDQKACFKSRHPQASGWALGVDDSLYEEAGKNYAKMLLLKNATSAVSGAVIREPEYTGFVYARQRRGEPTLQWVLIGHERAFCLTILNNELSRQCPMMYFGDFPSLAVADENNSVLSVLTGGLSSYLDNGPNLQTYKLAADYKGDDVKGSVASKIHRDNRVGYPSPVTNGFSADDVYLYEYVGGKLALRGLLPGVLDIMEVMPSSDVLPYGTVYENLDDTGDRYMYVKYNDSLGRLINLTAWEL